MTNSGGEKTNDIVIPNLLPCGHSLGQCDCLTPTTPKSEPDELELKTVDDAIFEIEDYIGGNIEGQETIDRMGLTVFLRKVLSEQSRKAVVEALKGLKNNVNKHAVYQNQDDKLPIIGAKLVLLFIDQAIERYTK